MADTTKLEAEIRELEARRAAGESVPRLDALYEKMDAATAQGHKAATEPRAPTPRPAVKKAKGGTASSRGDGCAQRGKTKGRMV